MAFASHVIQTTTCHPRLEAPTASPVDRSTATSCSPGLNTRGMRYYAAGPAKAGRLPPDGRSADSLQHVQAVRRELGAICLAADLDAGRSPEPKGPGVACWLQSTACKGLLLSSHPPGTASHRSLGGNAHGPPARTQHPHAAQHADGAALPSFHKLMGRYCHRADTKAGQPPFPCLLGNMKLASGQCARIRRHLNEGTTTRQAKTTGPTLTSSPATLPA